MGKREKNERKFDENTSATPSERTFRNRGKDEKYELIDVYDHDRGGKQEAERVGKGTEELFPNEKTRVAPVDVRIKAYGLYFRKNEEPKREHHSKDPSEKKERHFKSEASEKRFKEGAHERIKEQACESKKERSGSKRER